MIGFKLRHNPITVVIVDRISDHQAVLWGASVSLGRSAEFTYYHSTLHSICHHQSSHQDVSRVALHGVTFNRHSTESIDTYF